MGKVKRNDCNSFKRRPKCGWELIDLDNFDLFNCKRKQALTSRTFVFYIKGLSAYDDVSVEIQQWIKLVASSMFGVKLDKVLVFDDKLGGCNFKITGFGLIEDLEHLGASLRYIFRYFKGQRT